MECLWDIKKDAIWGDNIWGVDLADIQLISKYNKEIRFLLCVIDIYSKYPCVATLKDKKVWQLLAVFKKF